MILYTPNTYSGQTVLSTSITNFNATRFLHSDEVYWCAQGELLKCCVSKALFHVNITLNLSEPISDFTSFVNANQSTAKLVVDVAGKPFGVNQPKFVSQPMYIKLDNVSDVILSAWEASSLAAPKTIRTFAKNIKPYYVSSSGSTIIVEI